MILYNIFIVLRIYISMYEKNSRPKNYDQKVVNMKCLNFSEF